MGVGLSENEIKSLIKGNLKKLERNGLRKHIPLTDPFTYWVDEERDGTLYHCAYCGYKTRTILKQCPECHSKAIENYTDKDIHRYKEEMI